MGKWDSYKSYSRSGGTTPGSAPNQDRQRREIVPAQRERANARTPRVRQAIGASALSPSPESDRDELREGVYAVMDYALGKPLSAEAAELLQDEATRSQLELRSFAAIGLLPENDLNGLTLNDVRERLARIGDAAVEAIEASQSGAA